MLPMPPSSTPPPRWLTATVCAGLLGTGAAFAEAPETAPVPPSPPAAARAAETDPVTAPLPDQPEAEAGAAASDAPAAEEAAEEAADPADAPGRARDDDTGDGGSADSEAPGHAAPANGPAGAAVESAQEPADRAPETGAAGPDHEADEPAGPVVLGPPEDGPIIDAAAEAACEAALLDIGAVFRQAEPLTGEGPCGAPRPLTLSAVGGIEISPPVTGRCGLVRALANWVDRVAAPLADLYMDRSLSAVHIGTDYQCRRRRGATTSKWSEHAFANAVDVTGVLFSDGTRLAIEPREGSTEPARAYQAGIRGGACAFFTTVLGPTTNAAHADHLHLDMAERAGRYRLCE